MNPYLRGDAEGVPQALGDMLAYLWSVCHANDWDEPDYATDLVFESVEDAIASLAMQFSLLVRFSNSWTQLQLSVYFVCRACNLCGITPQEAMEAVACKFR